MLNNGEILKKEGNSKIARKSLKKSGKNFKAQMKKLKKNQGVF